MPTPIGFKDVFDEMSGWVSDRRLDYLRGKWPNIADRKAYWEWVRRTYSCPLFSTSKLSASEFIRKVNTIDFLDDAALDPLAAEVDKDVQPGIPLGRIGKVLYRLVPDFFCLRPHVLELPPTNRPVLPECFLGVNSTVQPREPSQPVNRRKANLSEESTSTADSDDTDAPGFIFFQLGMLEYQYCSSVEDISEIYDEVKDDFHESGFCVVARLTRFGRVESIHIIFDMFPTMDEEDARFWDTPDNRFRYAGSDWGMLPTSKDDEQFSCAKIGDRLAHFGFGVELELTEIIDHPVELVRVVRGGPETPMLRLTVDDEVDY